MKNYLIIFLACFTFLSCKKDKQAEQSTLNVTGYIKDYKGVSHAAKLDFYLIRPENRSDLASTSATEDLGYHSIVSFTARGEYNFKNTVAPGDYILVAQVSVFNSQRDWFRYSAKDIHVNPGDTLNEIIVFAYDRQSTGLEPWDSTK